MRIVVTSVERAEPTYVNYEQRNEATPSRLNTEVLTMAPDSTHLARAHITPYRTKGNATNVNATNSRCSCQCLSPSRAFHGCMRAP